MNKETSLQNEIRVALSKYGVVMRRQCGKFLTADGRRTVNIGIPGESDLEFIGYKFVAFIEVKLPGQKPRLEQERFLERMRNLGHRTGVAHSVEEALQIIGM
ncbi:MAG: VRR-NUC domain-containing protein [Clostridiales bacterium]|nr:VRR-NUC domain-containing protein [Clostridiales bacterium]